MTQNQQSEGHRGKVWTIYMMAFIMGGCGIAYEYTLSKISSDLMGNSVRQWAVTIGLMMFFMGIGSDLQKHLKDLHIFDKFIFFEVLLGMIGGFGPILLLYIFGSFRDHYVMVQYLLIILIGFLIGLEIPILARINESYTTLLKVNLGGILRMDYIGAFAGALVWVFVLPRFFSLTEMSFVLGVFNLVTAGLALWYFGKVAHRRKLLASLIVVCTVLLAAGLFKAPEWTARAEQKLFLDPIIYATSTKYQHIVMTRSPSGDIFCYINGNTQFSSFDEHIYHEFLVHPAMMLAQRKKKVLVLGGGDGLGLREILKYDDVESVTLVDLDPGMTDIARENEHLVKLNKGSLLDARVMVLENNALRDDVTKTLEIPDQLSGFQREYKPAAEVLLVNLDASVFVDQISGMYDVIIIDFPDPNNLELSKLYSVGFYRKVLSKLSHDGVVVLQATSPVHSKEAYLCIGRTMKEAGFSMLPFHENVPVFGEWGWWIGGRPEVYPEAKLKQVFEELEEIPVPVRHVTPDLIRASFVFGKESLETKETKVNTILNNVIFLYYQDAVSHGY